jgi:hypothetical protein
MTQQELERIGKDLGRRLEKDLGPILLQAFFHGPCVEPQAPRELGVRFSLVVARADAPLLSKTLHPILKRFESRRVAMDFVFTPEYIENARDVFPVEFLDFQARHRSFAGVESLRQITLDPANMHLQSERELRGLILHLRSALAHIPWNEKPVTRMLENTAWTLVPLFRALLALKGAEYHLDQRALLARVGEIWEVEKLAIAFAPGVLDWRDRPQASLAALDELLAHVDRSGAKG